MKKVFIYNLEIPYWISPDLLREKPILSQKIDIWSLGCMIIEMMGKKLVEECDFNNSEEFINYIIETECN